jgi:RNA polymerase sigma factor (sigma-70 family)
MSDRNPMDRLPSTGGPLRLLSDERLARRAAGGDQRAFAAIFQRYQADLYRFCRAIVRDGRDAEEALQNTMVKLLRALPGEERQIRLKPWLYRIARNEAVELLRKRREAPAIEAELPDPGPELAKTAEARERLRILLADLAELPERQRAALVMRELSGMGFAEIGAALETSAAVARQTVYEARLGLRQMEGGREMTCKEVTWELSGADGRVARRRDIKAHLRSCPDCRAFRDGVSGRTHDLAMLAPLPAAAAAALLHGALGGSTAAGSAVTAGGAVGGAGAGAAGAGGAAGSTGLGAGAGAAAGHAVASSAGLKALATVAVLAAGVTAADRSGLIDSPIPGGKGSTPAAHHGSTPEQEPGKSSGETGGAEESAAVGKGSAAGTAGKKAEKPPANSHASPNAKGHSGGEEAGEATHGSSEVLPAASQHGQETAASHGGGHAHGKSQAASQGNSHAPAHGQGHSKSGSHGHAGGRGHSKGKKGASGGKGSEAGAHPPGQEGANDHGNSTHPSTGPAPQSEVAPDESPSVPLEPSTQRSTKGAAPEAGGP